jgi:hypothetical protein
MGLLHVSDYRNMLIQTDFILVCHDCDYNLWFKFVLQVDFLRSCLVRTRVKVSQALDNLIQHCETYTEYDPLISGAQPSNPWISEDQTFWEINSPLYVRFIQYFEYHYKMRQESKFIRYPYIVQNDHWIFLIYPSSFPWLFVVSEVLLIDLQDLS